MDPAATPTVVKKQDEDDNKPDPKVVTKPVVKTLNRNACRKQKMRCEGADNPPCRRCRNTGLECLFEKPSREATLTGEAGLERIRSLEAHVAEIKHTQTTILSTLSELVAQIRGGSLARSPSTYTHYHQSPSLSSPSMSTPTASHQHVNELHPSPSVPPSGFSNTHSQMANANARQSRASISYQASSFPISQISPTGEVQPNVTPNYPNHVQSPHAFNQAQSTRLPQGNVLPPFSTLQSMGDSSSQPNNVSSLRYQVTDGPQAQQRLPTKLGLKRPLSPSHIISADSSDLDEEDNGELPSHGLVAPWEVLRGLADIASRRAAKENGDGTESHSRTRTPSPERQPRPSKRRKHLHKLTFPDVVTKNIITETEARELFAIFYGGCSTFLPVFDANTDTFDALHERSPFAVDCICMVASRVKDGGGKPSEKHRKCLEEVQSISCATLFAPVMRVEAVQAMILVSGWSDNGWLSGGHAVRMALELSMHKAWPRLYRRMQNKKIDLKDDKELVIATRTWFCLYLFEHQLSYGTGRPAVLKDDESIRDCRYFLQHPLSIEDDMRLVSTVELMVLREHLHNAMSPFDKPVTDEDLAHLRHFDGEFQKWFQFWDDAFSQKYTDAAFYRQSLQIQKLHAELFHYATALRGINGPEAVQKMPHAQRELAVRSIQIARQGLDITVNSPTYREGMRYAVHYTHAAATFAASFLLRLARLFPNDCNTEEVRNQVERLANLMSAIPGKRYALTLQLMLKRSKMRKASASKSPKSSHDIVRVHPMAQEQSPVASSMNNMMMVAQQRHPEPFTFAYNHSGHNNQIQHPPASGQLQMNQVMSQLPQQQSHLQPTDADQIWRGFEMTANEQLPVWISDQSLGGQSFSQNGIDAFLLPPDYLPPAPQIW
ncbi:hypothetical protein AMATHDRAFT_72582 [Amanita thiersii Skay4041]|uniref:Zn(2)-C6 fungal-type domain-containing protein n=1 Tax=Amanita thiersii Skay4041 TaxID=703135 RepID=A0A2A9P1Y6_9AGAR|nr:hypothetical protein AMATHDRAFT_72582 [Amanita thiersii Skay4041]